ncbi:MAG: HDIG domain-containing protein [Desulfosarcinaceae bacterium]|nr:HDIG domain-containing protein [Desulfosarcinaceae bacterium]
MRLLLNILLVMVALMACFVEEIYLHIRPLTPDQTLPITLRAKHGFQFDQDKFLEEKRQRAQAQYVPLYRFEPSQVEAAKTKMAQLIMQVYNLQSMGKAGPKEFVTYVKGEFGVSLPLETARRMLRYGDLVKLLSGILTIEETLLQRRIVPDLEPLAGKRTLDVRYPQPAGVVAMATADLVSLEKARLLLQERAGTLFWQVDKRILDPVLQLSMNTLAANLTYDETENAKRQDSLISQYPASSRAHLPGDVLIACGTKPSEEDLLLMEAYLQNQPKHVWSDVVWFVAAILLCVALFNQYFNRIQDTWIQRIHTPNDLLRIVILALLLFRAGLLFTPWPVFALPFATLPLLLVLLQYDRHSVVWTTVVTALLTCLFAGHTFVVFLYYTFSGLTAAALVTSVTKRLQMIRPAMGIASVNLVVVLAATADVQALTLAMGDRVPVTSAHWQRIYDALPTDMMGFAFAGGLATGALALLLLPLLESGAKTASTFTLAKYANLQHPLMKEMLSKSPGTYQHTMTVAYLAQAVGQAIDANVLLLQIGAYYHDLGKVMNPNFFTENQFKEKNPHEELAPEESTDIIVNHVKEGRMIGTGHRLPQPVLDLITQHHGTQLVEYFYHRAKNESPPELRPDEAEFRYPGPKPQTREAAVLMIVDTVEAASRSLDNPTRTHIAALVRKILDKKLSDGQFDECDLTTRDMGIMVGTLVDALEASLHSRVKYPWQEEEARQQRRRTLRSRRVSTAKLRNAAAITAIPRQRRP